MFGGKSFEIMEYNLKKHFESALANAAGLDPKTTILITHAPPVGIFDITYKGKSVGQKEINTDLLPALRPLIHAFGHNHDCNGRIDGVWNDTELKTSFINCSSRYSSPVLIDLMV